MNPDDLPSSPLIRPSELAALLGASSPALDVLVLDCRFSLADPQAGQAAWATGHIPGAVHADLDQDLSAPRIASSPARGLRAGAFESGRHPLPSPDDFGATLRRWGVSPHTRVVAYDDAGGVFAARAWWLLRWAGHARVQVLDGGWQAWCQAHGDLVSDEPSTRRASALTMHGDPREVVDTADVLAQVAPDMAPGRALPEPMMLLDARAPDRFRGDHEPIDPVGGHIPGALNRFFQLNLDAEGRFKPAAVLREEFEALLCGHAPRQVVHQCGSGVTACHNLLSMELAGLPGSRLYPGSWSAWCADPGRPIAR